MDRVPYALLARAEQDMRERFPDAVRVKALWTPASAYEVCVEVWRDSEHANVVGWQPTN